MTSPRRRRDPVLVVGAGISGLTAAIGLARAGWPVQVEDRGPGLDARGAALGIWPDAWRGLQSLGLAQRLTDAFDYESATIRNHRGSVIGHLPLGRIARTQGEPVRLVNRPELVHALADAVADLGVPVCHDRPFDTGRDLDGYALVVGADGIHSTVRDLVTGPVAPRSLGATAWRGSCAGHLGRWGEIWGRGMFAGVTPAGRSRTNWYVPVSDRLSIDTPDALLEALAGWPAEIRAAVGATAPEHLLRHPLGDLPPLATYTRGDVVLVGDAAHAMAPSLGRGACQAIADALALTGAMEHTDDPAAALAAYDRTQRPAGTRLVRQSRAMLRVQLSPTLAPVRDALLRAVEPIAPR